MQADASGKPGILEGSKAQQHLATIADYRDLVRTPTEYAGMLSDAGGDRVKVLKGILAITDPKRRTDCLQRTRGKIPLLPECEVKMLKGEYLAAFAGSIDKGLVPNLFRHRQMQGVRSLFSL